MSRNTEQGPGGANSKRATSSNLDQAPGNTKGKGISQKGGGIPANVDRPTPYSTSDQLTPFRASADSTAVRGGGGVQGHVRLDTNAGKANSGSQKEASKELSKPGRKQPPAKYLKG